MKTIRQRARRGTTTGKEGRFPHTLESETHTAALRADMERRGEAPTDAAVYRHALAVAAERLGAKR